MNIIFHFCPYILQIGHLKERLRQTAFIWTYIHDWLWEKQYNSLYFASEKAWIKTISVFPNLDPNPFNVFWLSANFFLHEIGATQSKHDHTVSGSSMKSCHGYFFFIHSSAISHCLPYKELWCPLSLSLAVTSSTSFQDMVCPLKQSCWHCWGMIEHITEQRLRYASHWTLFTPL